MIWHSLENAILLKKKIVDVGNPNYNYFFFVSIFILALIIYLVIHLYYKLKRKGIIKGAKQINTGVKEEDYLKKSKTMVPKKNSNNPLMTELINKGSKNND